MIPIQYFTLLFFIFFIQIARSKKISFEKYYKDTAFVNFLHAEFDYSNFLEKSDHTAEKYVPFQDSSNDTYFRVGFIPKSKLENYTKIRMEDQLGSLKNKPWMPVNKLREEFANCALFKYGTFNEHDFKYDKGMYGWMNIMKFSCTLLNDQFLVFAMAFSRTRFRLKQVYLKRQDTMWATSGRSLITSDVQKITEIFTIRFANFVTDKVEEEFEKHSKSNIYQEITDNPLLIKNDTFEELAVAYGRLKKHTKLSESRGHTFNTLAFRIKTRIFLTAPSSMSHAIESISDELSDAPLQVLDTCHKDTCTYSNMNNGTYKQKTETYNFVKENAMIHTMHPRYSLVAYQSAKPYFIFETMKRKTATKLVELKQHFNAKAKHLWNYLLEQQFALAIHVHNQEMFPFER